METLTAISTPGCLWRSCSEGSETTSSRSEKRSYRGKMNLILWAGKVNSTYTRLDFRTNDCIGFPQMGEIREASERSPEAFHRQVEQKRLLPALCVLESFKWMYLLSWLFLTAISHCDIRPSVIIACHVASNTVAPTRFLDGLCLSKSIYYPDCL